jgi:hypothetical protein
MAWETVDVPLGTFVGWGTKKGQHVTGIVTDYEENGGSDFNKNPCPLLEVELTERAASFNKAGERTDIDPGDTVLLTIGQVNLRKAVKKADVKYGGLLGKLVKITMIGQLKVAGGDMKEFEVQVDPNGGRAVSKSPASKPEPDDEEPPF